MRSLVDCQGQGCSEGKEERNSSLQKDTEAYAKCLPHHFGRKIQLAPVPIEASDGFGTVIPARK